MSDPNSRRIVRAATGAVVMAALMPVLAPLVVGAFGFGATGIAAGSAAAGMQAAIGNVAAGSAFAVAQSIGMGGAIPVVVTAVGAGLGAGVGAAAGTGSGGEEPKEGDPTDKDAGQDEAGEDRTPLDANGEGPVNAGIRKGRNRCPKCKRRRKRYCRHAQE